MLSKDEILLIHGLKDLGYSIRHVARETGFSRTTVRKYWNAPALTKFERRKPRIYKSCLDPYRTFIEEEFRRHQGNCDVVRQELEKQFGVAVALRTLQHYTRKLRERWLEERNALRHADSIIETPPGYYMQIDFCSRMVMVGGIKQRVHLFIATLGYSRRIYVEAFSDETQDKWLGGIERAFSHFGGIPKYIVCDNARALVIQAASKTLRQCTFHPRLMNFCNYWGVDVVASLPRYPKSKGKVERSVRYVCNNMLAGYEFDSWEQLAEHCGWWLREVSDHRVLRHLVYEKEQIPIRRFDMEKEVLRKMVKPPFLTTVELVRVVSSKGLITVGNRQYQLNPRFRNKQITIHLAGEEMQIYLRRKLIATLKTPCYRKHTTVTEPVDENGNSIFGAISDETRLKLSTGAPSDGRSLGTQNRSLLERSLEEYSSLAGGDWA